MPDDDDKDMLYEIQTQPSTSSTYYQPTQLKLSTMSGKGKGGRGEGKKSTTSSAKAGLQFPVGRIGRYLRQGKYATRMGASAPVYTVTYLIYFH